MKTRILNRPELLEEAAAMVRDTVTRCSSRGACNIGVTCDPEVLELLAFLQNSGMDREKLHLFQLTELCDENHASTGCRAELLQSFGLPLTELNGDNAAAYDAMIAGAGGLDLVILSVGTSCRIGYNEPGVPFESGTHEQKLTDRTRAELVQTGAPDAPYGLTAGIRTLTQAGNILVLAFGEQRASSVFQMLYARTDSVIPAAFLQLPPEVTVLCDPNAASKL